MNLTKISIMRTKFPGLKAASALLLFGLFCGVSLAAEEPGSEAPRVVRAMIYPLDPPPGSDQEMENLEELILRSFVEAYDLELEVFYTQDFTNFLDRLEAGEADIAGAALTITEERLKRFDFSAPYLPTLPVLVERRDEEMPTLAGRRIATMADSSTADLLREIEGVEIVPTVSLTEDFDLLAAGEVDGAATDTLMYLWLAPSYPDLVPTRTLAERAFCGFALQKGDPLKPLLDAHLEELEASGTLREFMKRAFSALGVEAIEQMTEGLFDE